MEAAKVQAVRGAVVMGVAGRMIRPSIDCPLGYSSLTSTRIRWMRPNRMLFVRIFVRGFLVDAR